MVLSPNSTFLDVFRSFPEDFQRNLRLSEKTKPIFDCIAIISCVLTLITILIVAKASSRLKAEYRNILLAQLTLAVCGCFLTALISPGFVLPYPVLFLSGPIAIDYRFTLYLSSLLVMLYFFPTMLLLSFGLIYNFMSLKQLATQIFKISLDRLLKSVIFTVTLVLLTANFFFLTQLSGDVEQKAMQKEIVESVDARCGPIFRKYAVFVFDLYSWPVVVASVEAIALSLASIVFCGALAAMSCKHFERQKPMLSAAAARNHRMMLYMLVSYVVHFLLYFSFPLAAFTIAMHQTRPFLGSLTFLLFISPAHFLGISLSVTYCLIITPYRKVLIAIVMVLTCASIGRLDADNRRSVSLSTLDNVVRTNAYRVSNQVSAG